MKMLSALFLLSCATIGALAAPEAPNAPYAPSGWRPRGPSFELPTRQEVPLVPNQYGAPEGASLGEELDAGADIEVTEEEVQYTGEVGTTEATTPFLQYGPPITVLPEDEFVATTEVVDVDDDLTVQGLPGTEPAQEFRSLTNERLRSNRVQKLRAQPKQQKSGRLQAAPARQQFFQGQFNQQQQFQNQQQFQRQQVAYSTTNGFQPPSQFGSRLQQNGKRTGPAFSQGFVSQQQFGRLTAPQNSAAKQRVRPAPVFNQRFTQKSQRQEAALDTYGAPAVVAAGPPAQEYGPPAQEYGPPPTQAVPQEEQEVELEPELPQEEADIPQVEEETTESNVDIGDEEEADDGGELAISNAVASGRYVLLQQTGRPAKLRAAGRKTAAKLRAPTSNLRQITEPIFTYNQFGQLVRIF